MKIREAGFWRWVAWPMGAVLASYSWLVRATARLQVSGEGQAYAGPAVYANWHEHIPYLVIFHGARQRYQLVSPQAYMAPIVAWTRLLGLRSARVKQGQRMREGFGDLAQLLRAGHSVVFAVDGPGGPVHLAKPGCCEVALQAAVPVIPVAYSTASNFRLRHRWDRALFPLPFDRVHVKVGAPVSAMAGESPEAMAARVNLALQTLEA